MERQNSNTTQNQSAARPNNATPQGPILIGFSTPDLNDRYLRYLEVAARVYAETHDAEFIILDARHDAEAQYSQIREMIDDYGVQGLIVIPVDANAVQPVTDMARQARIPLVYLNRDPFSNTQIPPDVYYVGSDSVDAGIKQANFLGENLGSGNIGVLMGIPNLEVTIGRTRGLEEELNAKYPNIKIITRGYANFLRQPAYNLVKQWLQQYGNQLNAIAANNDEMALGAIQALREAGRNDVIVVGVDATREGREAVQQGTLAATVFQDANVQGETAVNLVEKLIRGETPAQQVMLVPHILVTTGATSRNLPTMRGNRYSEA